MINRLIILGNGFDLAHGLKTKYSDFMYDYYFNIKNSDWKDDFFEFKAPGFLLSGCNDLNSIIKHIEKSCQNGHRYQPSRNRIFFRNDWHIDINNTFFYELSTIHSVQNWVDIENEYFKKMLKILDNSGENKFQEIKKLNLEMDMICKKFEEYLSKKVIDKIEECYNSKIDTEISNDESYMYGNRDNFYNEFPIKYSQKMPSPLELSPPSGKRFLSTLVLNFNYTPTYELLYKGRKKDTEIINIHGSLNDNDNPINLGFGDEMSKRYSEIEDYNENEYLRLMKSFAYSKTDNYKKLFDFVETNDFQVYIMGHSCGISDRTLLNAIFENHNCKSIKVFYHETVLNDGTKKDNYSDIVMNISRHFNKKTIMREKIVNKKSCQPLPQNNK